MPWAARSTTAAFMRPLPAPTAARSPAVPKLSVSSARRAHPTFGHRPARKALRASLHRVAVEPGAGRGQQVRPDLGHARLTSFSARPVSYCPAAEFRRRKHAPQELEIVTRSALGQPGAGECWRAPRRAGRWRHLDLSVGDDLGQHGVVMRRHLEPGAEHRRRRESPPRLAHASSSIRPGCGRKPRPGSSA